MDARLESIQDKTYVNRMRMEPESEHQKNMDAWITDMKNGRKEWTACQEATVANSEKMDTNPGEKKAVVERQEIPNKEAASHSLKDAEKNDGLLRNDGDMSRMLGVNLS
jgi:hypothetical protein